MHYRTTSIQLYNRRGWMNRKGGIKLTYTLPRTVHQNRYVPNSHPSNSPITTNPITSPHHISSRSQSTHKPHVPSLKKNSSFFHFLIHPPPINPPYSQSILDPIQTPAPPRPAPPKFAARAGLAGCGTAPTPTYYPNRTE